MYDPDDLKRMKAIAYKMLTRIDEAVSSSLLDFNVEGEGDTPEKKMVSKIAKLESAYDRLFNTRASAIAMLEQVADFLAKMEKAEQAMAEARTATKAKGKMKDPGALTDADIALVEAFIRKVKKPVE